MDRRGFIGGLLATAALPSVAADEPPVFGAYGGYERMALGSVRIRAGAAKPFSLLHISDTHLTSAYTDEAPEKLKLRDIRTKGFGGHQEAALRASIAWAKGHNEFLLHTGDLIDWQSRANYDLVRRYFGTTLFGSLGNHEYSPAMYLSNPREEPTEAWRARTRKDLQAVYPFDVTFASKVVHGVDFVTLDDVYGTVTSEQVERFRAEAKKGLPIVLCMHVPFYTDEIWRASEHIWTDCKLADVKVPAARGDYKRQLEDPVTADFIAYLKREPLLKGILTGHLHFSAQEDFSPTAVQYVVGANYAYQGQEVIVL